MDKDKLIGLLAALAVTMPWTAQAADLEVPPAVAAEPATVDTRHPFFRHSLMLQGGAAFNSISSSAAVGVAGGTSGTPTSFEDDLRFASSKTTFDALLRWRMSDRWMLEGEYFGIPRNSSASASRTIQFGGLSFPATAAVNADFDIQSIRLAVGYAFYKSTNTEIGAALSTYVSDFGVALRGSATLGGLAASFQSEKFSAAAPLPAIGIYANYAFTSRWLVSGRADYMDLSLPTFTMLGYNLKDVSGQVLSLEASTEYRLLENLGIGVGYRYMDVSMGATSSGLRGDIGYKISAPTAFIRASF